MLNRSYIRKINIINVINNYNKINKFNNNIIAKNIKTVKTVKTAKISKIKSKLFIEKKLKLIKIIFNKMNNFQRVLFYNKFLNNISKLNLNNKAKLKYNRFIRKNLLLNLIIKKFIGKRENVLRSLNKVIIRKKKDKKKKKKDGEEFMLVVNLIL